MGKGNLFDIFKQAFIDLYKNPIAIVPSLLLFVFFVIFSDISVEVNRRLGSNALLTGWLVFFSVISLLALGFFLSGLIGICLEIVKKRKAGVKDFFKYAKKFWFNNFVIIVIILVFYNLIWYIAHNGALLIGKTLNLALGMAQGLFFILYFAGLAGVIIFLTFSNFYLVLRDKGIFESLRNSTLLVKKEYTRTLLIIIIFFAINGILELLKNRFVIEIINTVFIVPYLALILARFVLAYDKFNSQKP